MDARAEGNPTKDEVRLMMQALLAERFKLVLHTETRQLPAYLWLSWISQERWERS